MGERPEEKRSFVLYGSYAKQFEKLDDKSAGQLIKAIFAYVNGKELPEIQDCGADMAFSFICSQLDRDKENYGRKCEINRRNAKLGGRPKNQTATEKPDNSEENQTADEENLTVIEKPDGLEKNRTVSEKPNGLEKNRSVLEEPQEEQEEKRRRAEETPAPQPEPEQTPKQVPRKRKNEYSQQFEEFWNAYPLHIGKAECFAKYQTRLKDGYSPEELLAAAKNYSDWCTKMHKEKQYIKWGRTFLSDKLPFLDFIKMEGDTKEMAQPQQQANKNKFNNFQQRDYDYAELERKMYGLK